MIDWLRYVVIGLSVLLGIAAYVDFRAQLAPRRAALVIGWVTAAVVVIQAIVAGVQMGRGHEMAEPATFIGYTATAVLLVPASLYLARIEHSRWASIVLCVAGFVIAVLQVRMGQLWSR